MTMMKRIRRRKRTRTTRRKRKTIMMMLMVMTRIEKMKEIWMTMMTVATGLMTHDNDDVDYPISLTQKTKAMNIIIYDVTNAVFT